MALDQGRMGKASDVHPTRLSHCRGGEKSARSCRGDQRPLTVQMFPSMQLGGEKEAIEQAQVGAIQLARVSVGALGPVVDELNVFNLPFLFRNTEHMKGDRRADRAGAARQGHNNPKAGLVGLCWMDAGARNMYDTKHPIKTHRRPQGHEGAGHGQPDVRRHDERSRRQRHRHGLRPGVQRPADRRGRRRGEQPAQASSSTIIITVAKYYTLTEHLIVPEVLVLSKKAWDALSKEDQENAKLCPRGADERALRCGRPTKQALEKAKAAGIQIIRSQGQGSIPGSGQAGVGQICPALSPR